MKHIILIFIILCLYHTHSSAHEQWVHQYIVQEAYRYLERHVGPIPALKNYVGIDGSGNSFFGKGGIDRPFEHQYPLAVGIWQEDEIDAVWEYSGLGGATKTTTHFWSAQGGDDVMTDFPEVTIGDRENAWVKTRIYMFPHENIFTKDAVIVNGKYSMRVETWFKNFTMGLSSIRLKYHDLCNLINTGSCSVPQGRDNILGIEHNNNGTHNTFFSHERAKIIGWNIFGRILHLLTDMGVPAHTHSDAHPCTLLIWDGEPYETWMGTNLHESTWDNCPTDNSTPVATNWTAKSASQHGGLLYEVFSMNDKDALRYLFYTMNRLSAHFASADENGNDWLWNGSSMLVSNRYAELGTTATTGSDGGANLTNTTFAFLGDELMNYAIRATATAMYWMAIKTSLVGCPETVYQQSHTYYGMRSYNEECVIKAASNIIAGSNVNSNLSDAQGAVIVKDGTLTYKAGEEIQLKPGFHAKNGSTFRAMIDNACPLTNQICTYSQNSNTGGENYNGLSKGTFGKEIATLLPDTFALTNIMVLRNTPVWEIGIDTIVVGSRAYVEDILRTIDSSNVDTNIIDLPISYYTDSVKIFSEQDSIFYAGDDSLLVNIPCFSKVILTDSVAYIIPYCTGISMKPKNDAPSIRAIYPNPNSSYIDVALENKGANTKVMIYSPEGIKLSETMVGNLQNQVRMSTQSLAAGTYIIIVQSEKGTTSKTFVIQR